MGGRRSAVLLFVGLITWITLSPNFNSEEAKHNANQVPAYLEEQNNYIESFKKLVNETEMAAPSMAKSEEQLIYGEARSRRLPHFVIIGMPKCGTGALQHIINAHSKLESADKAEMNFFAGQSLRGWEWYLDQMPWTTKDQLTFEKSAIYVRSATALVGLRMIKAKVLVTARDPFVTAVSAFTEAKLKNHPYAKETFEDTVIGGDGEINGTIFPISNGRFYQYLKPWIDLLPKDQLHIVDGDGLIKEPWEEMAKVQDFLGVEREITRDSFWLNETMGFYCLKKSGVVVGIEGPEGKCLSDAVKGRAHVPVSEEVEDKLRSYFRPGNEMFFELTGRAFAWK